MDKTACIFGSTGLIGSYLLELLSSDSNYSKIIVFNRKKQDISDPKIIEVIGDYSKLSMHTAFLVADEYYCCLGTTMKKAKTKPAFEYVDYHLPIEIGNLAKSIGVKFFMVVSSVGANPLSGNFYLRTKGGMEEALSKIGIDNLFIFRPSMLLGKRKEFRFMEFISKPLTIAFGLLFFGPLKKYKAIHGRSVAKAMIKSTNILTGFQVIESDKITDLSNA
jgi:uncharacterized protein YbjT (DUF2867 family)